MTRYRPKPTGTARLRKSRRLRVRAAELAETRPVYPNPDLDLLTETNGEEQRFGDTLVTNFTKGLPRTEFGTAIPSAYLAFVEAINRRRDLASGNSNFDKTVPLGPENAPLANIVAGHGGAQRDFFSTLLDGGTTPVDPVVRNWESPRSGHAYDLQGPDAEALCMPPAPTLESDELAVEMAEVYAMSLFRDSPFSAIEDGTAVIAQGNLSSRDLLADLLEMKWFKRQDLPEVERRRRDARGLDLAQGPRTLFRGSAPGAQEGPSISQFLLQGTAAPGRSVADGQITYGVQSIDQKLLVHRSDVDYMTQWYAWLDVQNGIDMKRGLDGRAIRPITIDRYENETRFLMTPRDLATYVHFDQLYQAYQNAALMMLGLRVPFSDGFPSGEGQATRGSFATFGGPHVLALVTEVSSRALRAVRRQKFNYHRRGRPEAMGLILTLAAGNEDARRALGDALPAADRLGSKLPDRLLEAVRARVAYLNEPAQQTQRWVQVDDKHALPPWLNENYLLPMAFPEGSPMHPAYGAGHATVAGACVTILKAYFQLEDRQGNPVTFAEAYEADPATNGQQLRSVGLPGALTLEGELNKLGANIAIGRNWAGVHYYTDYYDSYRLGERVAVGILQEQMLNYVDPVVMTLRDFDSRQIEIRGFGRMRRDPVVLVDGVEAGVDWWFCGS